MIEIFFSYAHADEVLMNDVRRQLIIHERTGRILKWHDRLIPPGDDWRAHIDRRINRAQIILLFVSPHFIESKYCYEIEGRRALARHEEGTAKVVPVILRPCAWQDAPFGKLQALPQDGRPISLWDDIDVATLEVANGVMEVVDELKKRRSAEFVVAGQARLQRGPASKPRATQPKSNMGPGTSKRTKGPTRGKAASRTGSRTDRG